MRNTYLEKVKYIEIGYYLFYNSIYKKESENLVNYFFYAFAVNCHDLKDWLINDNIFSEADINNHYNENLRLTNIAAIANKSKHFQLNRGYYKDFVVEKLCSEFSFDKPVPVFIVKDSGENESSEVTIHTVHKVLFSWDKLFKKNNLDQPFKDYR